MPAVKSKRLTKNDIEVILVSCSFSVFDTGFRFFVHTKGDGFLIQVGAHILDNEASHTTTLQKGGKQYISSYATKHEVVQIAFKACLSFVEHEAREGFKYKGADLYRPHWNVDELAALAQTSPHVKR